jgi:hypothetical protein
MPNSDPLLTFDQFWAYGTSNNFHLYFAPYQPGLIGHYADSPYYKACVQGEGAVFAALATELQKDYANRGTASYRLKLYEAYVMMYPYGPDNDSLIL